MNKTGRSHKCWSAIYHCNIFILYKTFYIVFLITDKSVCGSCSKLRTSPIQVPWTSPLGQYPMWVAPPWALPPCGWQPPGHYHNVRESPHPYDNLKAHFWRKLADPSIYLYGTVIFLLYQVNILYSQRLQC